MTLSVKYMAFLNALPLIILNTNDVEIIHFMGGLSHVDHKVDLILISYCSLVGFVLSVHIFSTRCTR